MHAAEFAAIITIAATLVSHPDCRALLILIDALQFRSLKSELGLRPIYHHKQIRADGHLFITV
ncbi:MAG: hypothetical protein L0H83_12255, partial [Salinisphaera sp.]|nr:hypothetical protein [Salinisphaera sp.]